MRSLTAVFLRHIFCGVSLIALTFALGSSSAPAQQVSSPNSLTALVRMTCATGAHFDGNVEYDTGYIAMLGMGEKTYSFRVIRDGVHALMIPAEQCSDPRPFESRPLTLILSHSFHNQQRVREGFHYLMNNNGQLMTAVHFQDGRSHRFAYANTEIPIRRADFESEKDIWLSKIAELASSRGEKRGAD